MSSSKIRVFIVDDSLTIRAMITTILERDPRIKVVGMAASAEEADTIIDRLMPDVVLLDVKLPGMDGIQFLRQLRRWLNKPVIMLSSLMKPGSPERLEAQLAGAAGAFHKGDILGNSDRLLGMIRDAAAGHLDPDMDSIAMPMPAPGRSDAFGNWMPTFA